MPGSSSSPSTPIFILNTIVANVLGEYADILEKEKDRDIKNSVIALIKDRYSKHKRIIFNGNGYENEWIEEAKKRGLSNLKNTVESLPIYIKEETIEVFEKIECFQERNFIQDLMYIQQDTTIK